MPAVGLVSRIAANRVWGDTTKLKAQLVKLLGGVLAAKRLEEGVFIDRNRRHFVGG